MSSSADEEALGKFATDQFREDQKYCAKIGLRATESRIRSLEKRIESVHCKEKVKPVALNDSVNSVSCMKDEAKRELGSRVQKERNELCEAWGQHRVVLQERPTAEEKRKGMDEYRRKHHRVVVNRDEEQIHNMIDDCVSKSVKKSLRKMRQNLFQRRINLAIHDRLINEWTLPKIKAELRLRGGRGEDQRKAPRLTVAEASPEVVAAAEEARP